MKKYYGNEKHETIEDKVAKHYSPENLLDKILNGLGSNADNLITEDLSPIEHFHLWGKEGTKELLRLAEPSEGQKVLDVGCGIGGTCRLIALEYKCHVTGIDLSPEFIFAAEQLTKRVGLSDFTEFYKASATALPFEDHTFNLAVSQHINMNIRDKEKYISEIGRVLRPGGKFAIYELFKSGDTRLKFPVPWADNEEISYLTDWDNFSRLLNENNMTEALRQDVSKQAIKWMQALGEKIRSGDKKPGPAFLGPEMGPKFRNLLETFQEKGLEAIQAVYVKR